MGKSKCRTFCPHCFRVVPAGKACPCRNRDERRKVEEPWRDEYKSAEFQRNRQVVIERQHGRCKDCGSTCAHFREGKWHTRAYGGEVDHEVPLREGGTNDVSNLALRCKRCHARADARRRESRRRGGRG